MKIVCCARLRLFSHPAEVTAILRDRVNDLLVANADLEKEVARLRYAHSAMTDAEARQADLHEAKRSLNRVAHENEQLKMAVGKARCARGPHHFY